MTLNGQISGYGELDSTDTAGNGVLTLPNGNAGFNGTVSIDSGTVKIGNNAALGTGSLTVNGGVLDLGNLSTPFSPPSSFSFQAGGISDGTLQLNSNLTADFFNAPYYDTATVAFISANDQRAYGVTVSGGGALFLLAGNNNYGGGTTVDYGNTLVYRWDGLNGEYSIPTGSTVAGTGTVESESAYFGPGALIWNSTSGGTWDASDPSNQVWLSPSGAGGSYVVPGNYGVNPAAWSGNSDPVFETPVYQPVDVSGTVSPGGSIVFVTGSDTIDASGQIDLAASPATNVQVLDRNATEHFDVPLIGAGGLQVSGPGTVNLGVANTFTGGSVVIGGTLQVGVS